MNAGTDVGFLFQNALDLCYRLVIQRQKRMDGELDLWEGEYILPLQQARAGITPVFHALYPL